MKSIAVEFKSTFYTDMFSKQINHAALKSGAFLGHLFEIRNMLSLK